MRVMQEMDFGIEEVDALTGTAVGWPKTATFRLPTWWAWTFWGTWSATR